LVTELTAAATGEAIPGGDISFAADGTSLGSATTDENGVAAVALPGKYRGGSHTYEAAFAGDDRYEGATASTS